MKTKLNSNPVKRPTAGVTRLGRWLILGVALLLGGITFLTGCQHTGAEYSNPNPGQQAAAATNYATVAPSASSRLQEGDVVKVVFEGDTNLTDWWWVAPGAEQPLKDAIRAALSPKR